MSRTCVIISCFEKVVFKRVFRLRIIMSGSGNGSVPFSVPVFRFSDLNFIMKLRNKHLEYKSPIIAGVYWELVSKVYV